MIQRGLLTLVCVVPLVAFGGAYRWLTLPLLLLAALTFVLNVRAATGAGRSQRTLDIALTAACACLAVQLVPLPPWLLHAVSPEAANVRASLRLDAPTALEAWTPLSIDPTATLHALGIAVSAALAFVAARGVFGSGGIRLWCRTLSWLGLVVALAAVVQRATSPKLIYGFWPPQDPNGQPFGPFVNRNHFAAWLLMAGFVVSGYAVAHARIHLGFGPRHFRRVLREMATTGTPIYFSAALVMAVTVVMTLSRSAMVGLVAGLLLAGVVARRRLRATALSQLSLAAAAILLGIAIVSGFVDTSQLSARVDEAMRSAPDSRVVIWRESLPLLRDFWATGVGAGAYSSAMLLYEQQGSLFHFNQAHSQYLQLATEGGMLLVVPWLLAAALFVRYVRTALAEDRSEIFFVRLGAVCGIVAIAVESIWETPLRMGANAMLFAVLCGIALHRRARQ